MLSSKHTTYVSFARKQDTGSTNVSSYTKHAKGCIIKSIKIILMSTCRFVTFLGGKLENEGWENANVAVKSKLPTKTNTLKKGRAICLLTTINPLKRTNSSSRPSMELIRERVVLWSIPSLNCSGSIDTPQNSYPFLPQNCLLYFIGI